MQKLKFALIVSTLGLLLISFVRPSWAAPSFQQAVADYNAGKYSRAVGEFKQFAAAYPTNAQSHYYMGLCYQSMGSRTEAKQQFELTRQYGDWSLKKYADTALTAMGSSGVQQVKSIEHSAPLIAQAPAAAQNSFGGRRSSKVASVLEFYTNWCGVCRGFAPSWNEAQAKVPSVHFEQYNAEDGSNAALVQKYNVSRYPTLVYLDKDGNLLRRVEGCPTTTDGFVRTIVSAP